MSLPGRHSGLCQLPSSTPTTATSSTCCHTGLAPAAVAGQPTGPNPSVLWHPGRATEAGAGTALWVSPSGGHRLESQFSVHQRGFQTPNPLTLPAHPSAVGVPLQRQMQTLEEENILRG